MGAEGAPAISMSLELTDWGTSGWECCGEAGTCRGGGGGGWCSAVHPSAPTWMEGTGEQTAGMLFWKRGSKTLSAHLELALHHLLLWKCSWRLEPQQEASGTKKSPGETGSVPIPLSQPMGSSALASKMILYRTIPAWDGGRKGSGRIEQIKPKEMG